MKNKELVSRSLLLSLLSGLTFTLIPRSLFFILYSIKCLGLSA